MRSLKPLVLITLFCATSFLAGCRETYMNQDHTTPVGQNSARDSADDPLTIHKRAITVDLHADTVQRVLDEHVDLQQQLSEDRKSTRLNSSHSQISYAVFCLKKKKKKKKKITQDEQE